MKLIEKIMMNKGPDDKVNPTEVVPEEYIEVSKQQILDFDTSSWSKGRGWEIPEYPIFNEAMEGLESGMFLVAGESNSGKSALLLDLIIKYSMNPENKLFGIYFSLDDTADKLIPRILAANAKLNCEEESGVPISVFSKPKRYLDKLNEIREDTDVSREDEARINYSYLYEDVTTGDGAVNYDNVNDTAPSYDDFPNSVRAKAYKWYNEKIVNNFKIVDGTKIHNGEQLYDFCELAARELHIGRLEENVKNLKIKRPVEEVGVLVVRQQDDRYAAEHVRLPELKEQREDIECRGVVVYDDGCDFLAVDLVQLLCLGKAPRLQHRVAALIFRRGKIVRG